jgi:hypothetical protein
MVYRRNVLSSLEVPCLKSIKTDYKITNKVVLLCGGCLKSHNLGITWCDIRVSVWLPAVWTRCVWHSKLINTNGLLCLSSDCDNLFFMASVSIISFIAPPPPFV